MRGRTYTLYEVYGNYDCAVSAQEFLYAWFNAYRKEVNAKVRNYNLRNLDKETNMKVLKLFMSGWQLHRLGNERVNSWLLSLLVIGMCIAS